jgi:hypothetical protein
MPREPKCKICTEPATKIAVDQLRAQATSIRDIALKVGRSSSSVGRHVLHNKKPAGKKTAGGKARSNRSDSAQTGRRCGACGLLVDDPSPDMLKRRSEKVLAEGERIMEIARDAGDLRLGLQALDRVQRSLDQLLKVHGMLGPDSVNVNVHIDNRRKTEALMAQLTVEELRALAYAKPIQLQSGEAIDAKAQPVATGTRDST